MRLLHLRNDSYSLSRPLGLFNLIGDNPSFTATLATYIFVTIYNWFMTKYVVAILVVRTSGPEEMKPTPTQDFPVGLKSPRQLTLEKARHDVCAKPIRVSDTKRLS